jgi:hypothetical protein
MAHWWNKVGSVTDRLDHWAAVRHGLAIEQGATGHTQCLGGVNESLAFALVQSNVLIDVPIGSCVAYASSEYGVTIMVQPLLCDQLLYVQRAR